ncbi:MAG: zinc-dependent alcohol dehydrogenase family protein [Chloroflexi bacterium]|nr:zinc-dependent alcohol dehydrogenase family protein [Chloroflexota bacterium]
MRRMLLRRTGPAEQGLLAEDDVDLPTPVPGQVLLRVLACGVCRTDLHIIEGELSTPLPRVPGHQVVGTIEALGAGVDGLEVGKRAGVGWLASTCGLCVQCLRGRENLCEEPSFTGRDVDGGFAEAMLADARFVYPLPASFSDAEAAPLLCAGIIGYRALKLSEIARGGRLGLIGFGASAHLAIQVARAMECEVFVFTRSEAGRELARELGAAWAGEVGDDPGVPLDAAVTFAPAGEVVVAALARLGRGGTVAVNAVHASDIPSFPYERLYWERTVRSVANFTRQDAREFLALAGEIGMRVQTEVFALPEANEALVRLKRGEVRGAAVLVP